LHCRRLGLQNYHVDLGRLGAPALNHLTHYATGLEVHQFLRSKDIVNTSRFTFLKELELYGWHDWDDLSPLWSLPLIGFSCTNFCMLLSLLGPDSMQSLKSVTINCGSVQRSEHPEQTWRESRGLNEETVIALISEGLLALPSLEEFREGEDYCVANGLEGWVKKTADLHPDHWLGRQNIWGSAHYHRVR